MGDDKAKTRTPSLHRKSKLDNKKVENLDADVEQQVWYHGFRPRRDIEHLLIEDGDFLVRATDGRTNNVELVLSVKTIKPESGKVVFFNLTIVYVEGKWQLGIIRKPKNLQRFSSIATLIEYYKKHKITGHLVLKRAISRPDWLIKHEKVVYDAKADLLGSGNFCDVYKGIYTKNDEKFTVAVKICHQGQKDKSPEEQREAREMMLFEAKAMSYFVHRYIIRLHGVALDHPPVLIVMEFCPGGSLDKHLEREKDDIEIGERVCYIMDAARGMRYLHEKGCVHRDLAARNCLISAEGFLKIADFGLSKLIDNGKEKEEGTGEEPSPQIPLRWMAPESLKRPVKFSTASDCWAFGVLMFEVFNNGGKPFPDFVPRKIATLIRKGSMPEMPEKTPEEIKEVVSKVWVLNPTERLKMKDICTKVWRALKSYPPPKPEKFAVNRIPGVTRTVTMKELGPHETTDDKTDTKESQDNADTGRTGSSPKPKETVDASQYVKKSTEPAQRTNMSENSISVRGDKTDVKKVRSKKLCS